MAEEHHSETSAASPDDNRGSGKRRRDHAASLEVQQEELQMENQIGLREARRMQYIAQPPRSVWFGLGMFGLVGWSVTVPALIGIAIGVWIDTQWPGPWSWTLMLLMAGVTIGCLNAWAWVSKESRLDATKRSAVSQKHVTGGPTRKQADRSDHV